MEKVDSMQEQMGNIIRQMETLRRNKKEIQDTKKHCSRNKQKMPFMDSLIHWTQLKKISKLENMSIESSKTEKHREKRD